MTIKKPEHEIEYGAYLAENEPEEIWGWGSPAGKIRAERRAQAIINAANLNPTHTALEIGCGNGNFTEKFLISGAKLIAIDISPNLIELARQRNLPDEQVIFICDRFENFTPTQEITAIIGSSVLHHLEIEEGLNNIAKILKPGGKIAFAEPNFLNPQVLAEKTFLRPFLAQVSPDETAFTRWGITEKLIKAGFTNIEITPFDWLHPVTPQNLIGFVSKAGEMFEKIPIVREFSGSLLITGQKA